MKAFLLALPITMIAATTTLPAAAETDEEEQTQQCIHLQYVNQTPVIDNKTILVEMKGNKYKRIDLRNRCSGLKLEGGFSHSTSINKLCKQDTLRVLRSGGFCMIDKIVDITEEEAKALKKKS
ncbi:MAG: DUF6491 family protein [Rhodospirillaceae bacterium]|nr:DUF6491 family protein [Rhodospirillaceae bacterium]